MIHQRHRQTDRQTTCDLKTALCTIVHRAVKTATSSLFYCNDNVTHGRSLVHCRCLHVTQCHVISKLTSYARGSRARFQGRRCDEEVQVYSHHHHHHRRLHQQQNDVEELPLPLSHASSESLNQLHLTTHTKANERLALLRYTHTHNRFTALLEFVRDHPGEHVPER